MKRNSPWEKGESIVLRYGRQLRHVAREVGRLITGFGPDEHVAIREALARYAAVLEPWARQTSTKIVRALNRQDEALWQKQTSELSLGVRQLLAQTDVQADIDAFVRRNTVLITSLPTEAAERVQRLTLERLSTAERSTELVQEILRTGQVTEARATLIARTETSRTANQLTKLRAESIGVEQAIWRTSRDADVRPDHRRLEGVVFDMNNPPVSNRTTGERNLPGHEPNCRCWLEPIVTDLE